MKKCDNSALTQEEKKKTSTVYVIVYKNRPNDASKEKIAEGVGNLKKLSNQGESFKSPNMSKWVGTSSSLFAPDKPPKLQKGSHNESNL